MSTYLLDVHILPLGAEQILEISLRLILLELLEGNGSTVLPIPKNSINISACSTVDGVPIDRKDKKILI